MDLWGEATLIDKSVCFRSDSDSNYNFGECLRGCRTDNSENGILEIEQNRGSIGRENLVGVSISHVGDLVVTGSDMFIRFISGEMKGNSRCESFERDEAIYLRMQILVGVGLYRMFHMYRTWTK